MRRNCAGIAPELRRNCAHLQVALDLLAPVGVLRVRVVDHVVLELLHLPLEPPDRLQVGEEQRRRRRHLGRLRLQLLRQHDVTHHLRQVLARRAERLRRRRARLELLTQRLGLLLELAEQPLARRSELLEDERPRSELFVPHELAQQGVALEARRRQLRLQPQRHLALARREGGMHRLPRRLPLRRGVLRVAEGVDAVEGAERAVDRAARCAVLLAVAVATALSEQRSHLLSDSTEQQHLREPLLQRGQPRVGESARLPRPRPKRRRQPRGAPLPRLEQMRALAHRLAHLLEGLAPQRHLAQRRLHVRVERGAEHAQEVEHPLFGVPGAVEGVESVLQRLEQLAHLLHRQLREGAQLLGDGHQRRPVLLGVAAAPAAHRAAPPELALVVRRAHAARVVLAAAAARRARRRRAELRVERAQALEHLRVELRAHPLEQRRVQLLERRLQRVERRRLQRRHRDRRADVAVGDALRRELLGEDDAAALALERVRGRADRRRHRQVLAAPARHDAHVQHHHRGVLEEVAHLGRRLQPRLELRRRARPRAAVRVRDVERVEHAARDEGLALVGHHRW